MVARRSIVGLQSFLTTRLHGTMFFPKHGRTPNTFVERWFKRQQNKKSMAILRLGRIHISPVLLSFPFVLSTIPERRRTDLHKILYPR